LERHLWRPSAEIIFDWLPAHVIQGCRESDNENCLSKLYIQTFFTTLYDQIVILLIFLHLFTPVSVYSSPTAILASSCHALFKAKYVIREREREVRERERDRERERERQRRERENTKFDADSQTGFKHLYWTCDVGRIQSLRGRT
jgi:uncharacterized membrane protein